jgi:ribosomal protein S18 acetylase RimI-like enzyme
VQVASEAARPSDVAELQRLRNEAASWLLGRGIEQWSVGEIPTSAFEAQVASGEWHLVRSGRRVVACLRLLWADAAVWGETAPVAGYVHGLTTDRQHGRGLGRELLDWAGAEVVRQSRTTLRLDCQERNLALRAYYRRLGFHEVGLTDFDLDPYWHPVVRFERNEA